MADRIIKILKTDETLQIPIVLHQKYDDLGVMSYFDGNIELYEKSNFTYSGNGKTIIIYNTINTFTNKEYLNVVFKINWGDGYTSELVSDPTQNDVFPNIEHSFLYNGDYFINITIDTPWKKETLIKKITIPFEREYPINLGELTFKVPYNEEVTINQKYYTDYSELTGKTEPTDIFFMGFGKSRLHEFKKYGDNDEYIGVIYGEDYVGYNLDGLFYMDYNDGITQIVGKTNGTIENFFINDQLYHGMLTRDEHFVGFIDEPKVFSDVNVNKGKISVMEYNFKILEVDNIGELISYGNKFFNIKNQ